MARKYHEIKGLAEFTAKMITSDEEQWKKFLHSRKRIYAKYQEHKNSGSREAKI